MNEPCQSSKMISNERDGWNSLATHVLASLANGVSTPPHPNRVYGRRDMHVSISMLSKRKAERNAKKTKYFTSDCTRHDIVQWSAIRSRNNSQQRENVRRGRSHNFGTCELLLRPSSASASSHMAPSTHQPPQKMLHQKTGKPYCI